MMERIATVRSEAFRITTLLVILLVCISSPSLAKPVKQEAKYNQGEGQFDFVTIDVDIQNVKGKLLFLHSELSNIPDPVVVKAGYSPGNKHNLDLSKYQHLEFEFSLFQNAVTEMLSFFSPVLTLQDIKYFFVFIGTAKGTKILGTLYKYRINATGEKYLTEIQIK
jgi:hypothetical protein